MDAVVCVDSVLLLHRLQTLNLRRAIQQLPAPLGPHQPSSLCPPLPRPFRRQLTLTALLSHHLHPPPPPPPPPSSSSSSYSSSYPSSSSFFSSCSSTCSSAPTTAALAAVTHINATHIPDTTTDTTSTTSDSRGEDRDYTCLH
ncbi:hypothetical protein SprV_0702461100 [Sparganum proliferum]